MNMISKKGPLYFEFDFNDVNKVHFHDHVELVYVFSGEVEVEVDKESFVLNKDDFMIINSNKQHRITEKSDMLVGSFYMDYALISEFMKQTHMVFWCNSVIDKSSAYDEVRLTVKNMVKDYFEDSGVGKIRLLSLYYELFYQITKHFLVTNKDTHSKDEDLTNKERIMEITNYVAINYRDKLSLSTLAENLFLSESYLSKYIKRKFGMNFMEYVNNVRLNHAMDDLLYEEKPITRIAMENGFANVGTFNRVFKVKYGMPPKAYKTSLMQNKEDQSERQEQLYKRIEEYIGNNPYEKYEYSTSKNKIETDVKVEGRKYKKVWNNMINAGTAVEILSSNLQDHIMAMRQNLQFKYVRIWDLYSPEMYIDINAKNKYYNFDKLNRVFDIIVKNNLYPYIDLSIKPKQLLRNATSGLIVDESILKFDNLQTLNDFIQALIFHLIDRYSMEEVENWYFELWKEEADVRQGAYSNNVMDTQYDYLDKFSIVYKIIKSYLPSAKIGGAGLSIRYGQKSLVDFLSLWNKMGVHPDFLSFYCYPYLIGTESNTQINRMSTDRNYLTNYIEAAQEAVKSAGLSDIPIHISEWNLTVSNRNVLNDSCHKGAFVMKNLIQALDSVDLIGYWFASDVFADYYDSNSLLNGSSGLVSKDGISKPVYFAFDFLNRLGSKLLAKGENYIITDSGYNETRIACHNYKFLNHHYFMRYEDEVELHKLDMLYEDLEPLTLKYELNVEKEGQYEIKIHGVNRQYGSVQDEWIRMACPDNLNQEEIKYLKQVCVPRITINQAKTKNNKLYFSTTLEPNEIQFIQVKYKFK